MSGDPKLAALTRSLMLGVSVGTISLALVGCAALESTIAGSPADGSAPQPESQGSFAIEGLAEGETQLCSRALETKSPEDVDAVLVRYPRSRCVGPLLAAMPAATLGGVSRAAISGIPRTVFASLPERVLMELPNVPRVQQALSAVRSDGSSDGSGY